MKYNEQAKYYLANIIIDFQFQLGMLADLCDLDYRELALSASAYVFKMATDPTTEQNMTLSNIIQTLQEKETESND